MGKRKDPLIEFRDYYNSLSPDAQDVARRLLFGETRQRPKSSPAAQPVRRQSSSKKPAVGGLAPSTVADVENVSSAAQAAGGD